jgi:predicted permease
MRAFLGWISRVVGSLVHGRSETHLDDELAFHLEMQTRKEMERGLPEDEARRVAARRLGGLDQTKDAYRDQRGLPWLDTLIPDLRYAWRTMRRDVGFALIALATLAIGIGATTTIFSLLRGVVLAPLPYPEPERLVRVYESNPGTPIFPVTPYSLVVYRHDNRTLAGIAGFTREDLQLAIDDRPERLRGLQISSNYFDVLGIRPAIGRTFTWSEERANAKVAIISHNVWRDRFHGDREVIGRQVRLSGTAVTIVGVMPPGFEHVGGTYRSFPQGQTVDVWWPLPLDQAFGDRYSHYVNAVARLKPGVTAQQAMSDLSAIRTRITPTGDADWTARLIPLLEDVVGPSTEGIRLLMAAAGLVLLITCANVSSLLLARGTARRRERAVRFALGAARGRLVRQSLTESLALTIPGSLGGAAVAIAGVAVLRVILPQDFPRLHNIHIDWMVLAFSIVVACVSAAVFGLLPAWHEATDDVRPALHEESGRSSAGRSTTRTRNLLVVGEIALASALLVTAGLLARSFVLLERADPGFQPSGVLTASVALPPARYADPAQRGQFFQALLADIRRLPGVAAAGAGTDLPWTGYDENGGFQVVGGDPNRDGSARYHAATPGYFEGLRVPVLDGRAIDDRDLRDGAKVLVVNRALIAAYLPGESAIGRVADVWGEKRTIIGVVGDIKDTPSDAKAQPAFWFPYSQVSFPTMSLVIRTGADPSSLVGAVRQVLRARDPELALAQIETLDNIARAANGQRRFLLAIIALFTAAALVLALVGAYGVLTWTVRQRRRELGIRVALGADRKHVLSHVVGQGLRLGVFGLTAGFLIALAAGRILQTMLYGVSPRDAFTFGVAGAAMLVLSAGAALGPAWLASRTNPVEVLRLE